MLLLGVALPAPADDSFLIAHRTSFLLRDGRGCPDGFVKPDRSEPFRHPVFQPLRGTGDGGRDGTLWYYRALVYAYRAAEKRDGGRDPLALGGAGRAAAPDVEAHGVKRGCGR